MNVVNGEPKRFPLFWLQSFREFICKHDMSLYQIDCILGGEKQTQNVEKINSQLKKTNNVSRAKRLHANKDIAVQYICYTNTRTKKYGLLNDNSA